MWYFIRRRALRPRNEWTVTLDEHLVWMKRQHEIIASVAPALGSSAATNSADLAMSAIVGTADLQVVQRVSNSQPAPSAPLTCAIDVKNAGPNTALGAALSEYVGVDGTPVGATSSNGAPCSVSGELVSCSLGDMASGSTVTVSVSALAPASFGGTIASTATASCSTYDPNVANTTASASVRMP